MIVGALIGVSLLPGLLGFALLAERIKDALRRAAARAREGLAARLLGEIQPALAPFGTRHWILLSLDVAGRAASVADSHGPEDAPPSAHRRLGAATAATDALRAAFWPRLAPVRILCGPRLDLRLHENGRAVLSGRRVLVSRSD